MKAAVWLACAGCLGPQVSDQPAPSGDIVLAGSVVPPIDEEADDAAQLAASDGVDGTAPLLSAFSAGAHVHVWDFGAAPSHAAPVFMLMQRQGDGSLAALPHPMIVGSIAGDPGYSPFREVFALVVTDAYAGELITSTTAIDEAVTNGLIEAPVSQMRAIDVPQVASDVRLDVGGATLPPSGVMYYEHHAVAYFDFGAVAVTREVDIAPAPRYVLRREGGEPLSEPIRGVDMDGDGDIVDSNDILAATPLVQTVNVVVVAGTTSIDTSQSDAQAQITDAAQLFDPQPIAGTVVSYEITTELRNMPAQRTPGGL